MGGKLQIRSPNLYETQFDVRAFCSPNSWDYSAGGSFCRRQEVFIAVVKMFGCEFTSACSLQLPVPHRSLWPGVCVKMEPTLAQVWNMGCDRFSWASLYCSVLLQQLMLILAFHSAGK